MAQINIRLQYPRNEEYYYETFLERINLDEEREKDILSDNGFILSSPEGIRKEIKNPNGIFSSRFGQDLQHVHNYGQRYRCECGYLNAKLQEKIICPLCNKEVVYVDDNFKYFGWIVLKDKKIIHPNLYKSISFFIGNMRFQSILDIEDEKDIDGHSKPTTKKREKEREKLILYRDEPYYGIGMIDFYEKFDEIMNYYLIKNPDKKEYYIDIMGNRDNIFTSSIPVYSALLRPFLIVGETFSFEMSNKLYMMMSNLAAYLNKNTLRINRKNKPINHLLWDLQSKFNDLYDELVLLLSGKKGSIRTLFGGRYNFTARAVIVANQKLRIDQVTLPYIALLELMQQTIINLLKKTYNMTYAAAHKEWESAKSKRVDRIYRMIDNIIRDREGIPVLINRNPTIGYGGIIQMFCVAATEQYTLGLPLQILKPLGADFDGDTLNVLYIINQKFLEQANRIFNPKNAMYISRNDGYFNNACNHSRDTLINVNAMIYESRDHYTQDEINNIKYLQSVGL